MERFLQHSDNTMCIIETPILGLTYIKNFITYENERSLIQIINKQPWNTDLKRFTQQYGYHYNYINRSIYQNEQIKPLPDWIMPLLTQINDTNQPINQAIINRYLPGEGISAHIDSAIFGSHIYSISLGSPCMFIYKKDDENHELYVLPRSLIIMSGPSRTSYTHEIIPRKIDNNYKRTTRYSITFRHVL